MINEKMLALGTKRSIIREIFEYGNKRKAEIGAENVFDFSLGNPSVEPPKTVNEAIVNLTKQANQTIVHGYTSAQGDVNCRKAIANDIKKRFSVDISENNIYMTCGAAASLTITLNAICNAGEEVITFAPYFTEYGVFCLKAGANLMVLKTNPENFQIDFDEFEKSINKNTTAVLINSPNNPSGVVYSENTIKTLCEILNKKQKEYNRVIFLISDEPYRELVYGDVFVPYTMNYYDNSIVCYSYSKSLSLPGERIGYIAVSPKMQDGQKVYFAICGAGRVLGYVCAPSMMQKVITSCVGQTGDISAYKRNRDALCKGLSEYGYKFIKPDGAFYLFVEALEEDAVAFCEKAKQFELLLVPSDDFGVKGYARIAYCVSYEQIINSMPSFKKLAELYK